MALSLDDPVDFSIGEPDFDTPEPIKQAAIRAISEGYNNYTVSQGSELLREGIGELVRDEFGWSDPCVLVTCGVSGGLFLAFLALLNEGDEVLVADPYFVSYRHLVELLDGRCVYVDCYGDFQFSPEKLRESISERSKVLIINSPANPTGVTIKAEQMRALAEIAREHELLVISDEIYREFSYDEPAVSMASFYENTLVLRGFSKSYGMPGWRVGYVAGASHMSEVIERMTTLQQYTYVCSPHPFQRAGVEALRCDMSEEIERYRRKRDMIYEGLKGSFELVRPEGAFYAFVRAPGDQGSEFVMRAIQNKVLIIPGSVFSQRDSHFRISYATSDEKISEGIERLCELAKG